MATRAKHRSRTKRLDTPEQRKRRLEAQTLIRNIRLQQRVSRLTKQLRRATNAADAELRACWFKLETYYGADMIDTDAGTDTEG